MGDLLGSFPGKYASEDNAYWKDSCWFVGTHITPLSGSGALQMVSEPSLSQYGVVRGRTRRKLVGM